MESSWNLLVVVTNSKVPSKRVNFRVVSLAEACCDSNLCRRSTSYVGEQWFAAVSNSRIGKPAVDFPRIDTLFVLQCAVQILDSGLLECYAMSTDKYLSTFRGNVVPSYLESWAHGSETSACTIVPSTQNCLLAHTINVYISYSVISNVFKR